MTKKISVFGSSSPKPGAATYQKAYELGKLLGSAGMTVLTGGYMGTMEATSRGASEAGAHVIGVTSEEVEAWRPVGPNQWVAEEWRCQTYQDRLYALVENCNACLALPGGIGTLLEVTLAWSKLVVNVLPPKPLILIGNGWHKVIETFYQEMADYVPYDSREYISFAPDNQAAFELLKQLLSIP